MIILGFQGGVTGVVFIDGAQSSRLILLQEGRRGAGPGHDISIIIISPPLHDDSDSITNI